MALLKLKGCVRQIPAVTSVLGAAAPQVNETVKGQCISCHSHAGSRG